MVFEAPYAGPAHEQKFIRWAVAAYDWEKHSPISGKPFWSFRSFHCFSSPRRCHGLHLVVFLCRARRAALVTILRDAAIAVGNLKASAFFGGPHLPRHFRGVLPAGNNAIDPSLTPSA